MSEFCLLCKEREVYQIKSHLTPAGITENTYGERNKELIYTIDPGKKTIDKYFGRGYSQQETTEIKDEPNARRGIFCKQCETNFGTYESEVQNKLNKFINNIGNGNGIQILRTEFDVKYAQLDFHPNILTIFFLSIVWRQSVEQVLDKMDNPLSDAEFEKLRNLVLDNISVPLVEIIEKEIIVNPKLTIFTTYNTKLQPTWANPHLIETNPQVFFIGPIILLYWINENHTVNFQELTSINKNLLDSNLTLDKLKIAVVNQGLWKKISNTLARSLAKHFLL